MCYAYYPVHKVVYRAWDYYERAQRLLEEARDRQVELGQALDDLAEANLQYARLNTIAQGLRRAAEEARTAKEQFVANVSHELRTPLNMIIGFSEMVLREPQAYGNNVPPTLLADLAVIQRNAAHLSELIDDVLDLSQVEADQMALTKENVDFHELVEAVKVAVRPLFDSKGLRLQTDVPKDLPPVFCDRTRIREVLLNLLSNAGRFTERGGVQVRAWQEEDDLVVCVADSGPGIAPEDVDRLFQPFQQLDGSIRRRYGGTGLGLSISKRFVELHGGKIWIESEAGAGATIFFRLPFAPRLPVGAEYQRGLNPTWEFLQRTYPPRVPATVIRPRFVVLEEGDALRHLVTRYLDGVEVVPVTSLEEAARELSQTPGDALLVNDVSVAGALERLETVPLPYSVPVVVCSIVGLHESAAAMGVSDYLIKPISRDGLLESLDRLDPNARTVLIVDDEPETLRLFRRMLTSSGRDYRVLRARDGQEAMNILRSQRPDVVLLDLIMPKMDGFQLLEAKSQDPDLSNIPVIVISARDPAGHPIVSKAVAIMRESGLSAQNLLTYIRSVGEVLARRERFADLAPTAVPPD